MCNPVNKGENDLLILHKENTGMYFLHFLWELKN